MWWGALCWYVHYWSSILSGSSSLRIRCLPYWNLLNGREKMDANHFIDHNIQSNIEDSFPPRGLLLSWRGIDSDRPEVFNLSVKRNVGRKYIVDVVECTDGFGGSYCQARCSCGWVGTECSRALGHRVNHTQFVSAQIEADVHCRGCGDVRRC